MLDSSLFVKALGIGIAVAAPVGPMSLLCMRTTLTRGCGVSNMRSAELVGVAQPIACCGKFGGVGGRRQIAQRRVRSPPIVVVDPARDPFPCVIEPKEQALVGSSSRMRPLKLSQKPFCIGFPGAMKRQTISLSLAKASMAFEVNSVPSSETIMPGLPRRSISAVGSRATRRSEIEVSGIAARHSRVTSSTMFRMRNRRPQAN